MTTSAVEGTRLQRPVPADTFAGRLMLTRLHAGGLTIQEAAARAGLLNQSWSNWERGKQPRDKEDVVTAISEALDVDRDWLMWGGPLSEKPGRTRSSRQVTTRYAARPSKTITRPRDKRPATRADLRRPNRITRQPIAA